MHHFGWEVMPIKYVPRLRAEKSLALVCFLARRENLEVSVAIGPKLYRALVSKNV